jgi:hypothetical protein
LSVEHLFDSELSGSGELPLAIVDSPDLYARSCVSGALVLLFEASLVESPVFVFSPTVQGHVGVLKLAGEGVSIHAQRVSTQIRATQRLGKKVLENEAIGCTLISSLLMFNVEVVDAGGEA